MSPVAQSCPNPGCPVACIWWPTGAPSQGQPLSLSPMPWTLLKTIHPLHLRSVPRFAFARGWLGLRLGLRGFETNTAAAMGPSLCLLSGVREVSLLYCWDLSLHTQWGGRVSVSFSSAKLLYCLVQLLLSCERVLQDFVNILFLIMLPAPNFSSHR